MNAPGVQIFYQQIAANRRRSVLLVFVIMALLAVFGFVIGFAVGGNWQGGRRGDRDRGCHRPVADSVISYFAGDSIVLAGSGAREVNEQIAPQLMNIVREMAIAANVPMPKVYVINDTAPNAFATGRDPSARQRGGDDGLLEKLDREELQGVLGHELSHVRNLDIRFALLVAVLVGSIALLADFFLRFTIFGWSRLAAAAGIARGRRRGL